MMEIMEAIRGAFVSLLMMIAGALAVWVGLSGARKDKVAEDGGGATYGCTWDDVDLLRALSSEAHELVEIALRSGQDASGFRHRILALDAFADRIAALLPPRT